MARRRRRRGGARPGNAGAAAGRLARIERKTRETEILLQLNVDGTGEASVESTIPFLNHMLEAAARHGLLDLKVDARGDTEVDLHHTVEDVAICLGKAFADAMASLDRLGLVGPLRAHLLAGRPFLGICLGYQLLFTESEEFGQARGLDVIPGAVRRFPKGLKVPHMGWNRVEHDGGIAILEGIPSGAYFYFVHSYYPEPQDPSLETATCTYGVRFPAVVAKGGLFATQFHPEKSQAWGLRLLANFAGYVERAA